MHHDQDASRGEDGQPLHVVEEVGNEGAIQVDKELGLEFHNARPPDIQDQRNIGGVTDMNVAVQKEPFEILHVDMGDAH